MKYHCTLQLMMAAAIAGSSEAARGDTRKDQNMQLRDNKKRVLKQGKSSGGGGDSGSGGSGFWNHIWNQIHGDEEESPDESDPNNEFGYDGSNYQNDIVNGGGFTGTYPEGTPSKYLPQEDIPYGPAPGTAGYTGYSVRGYPDRNGD